MTDQLSLRLDAELPNLPTLRPMLPRPLAEPFDSPEHLFEPTWGGRRVLAFVGPSARAGDGEVRLVGATGEELTAAFPELSGLAVRVQARSAILDGELVVVDGAGRSDAAALAARIGGRRGRPAAFLAFDLLHLDGRSLLGVTLERRRRELRRVLRPGDEVVAVPAIAGEGRALFDAVASHGLDGVMARQRLSPYLPGVTSRLWGYIDARAPRTDPAPVQGDSEADTPSSGPVLALIRRLPLLDEDDTT